MDVLAIFCVLLLLTEIVLTGRPYVNDPDCPRKPEQTINRKCLKKCLSDSECKGRSRRCLCDDVCGKSCVRPTSKCEPLNTIVNGRFEITPFNTFGAKVRYTCNEGHILTGQAERVCQGDGFWSGEAPTCDTEGKCREPPEVPYASHDGSKGQRVFPLGTQLTYTCESGYDIDGFFRAMCVGEGRWVGPRMTCTPRRCHHPGDIPNGRRDGNVFIYPHKVTYSCSEGYELVGSSYRICQASGQWSRSLPRCRPIKCPQPTAPLQGDVHGSDFTYGATVSYTCLTGFKVDGPTSRRCLQDGTWAGDEPQCKLVECQLPNAFHNGYFDVAQTTFGSIIYYRCIGKAKADRNTKETTAKCLEDGTWSNPLPTCWTKCTVPEIENMIMSRDSSSPITELEVEHDDPMPLGNCSTGYQWLNESYIKYPPICHNGTWTYLPLCVEADCKSRPPELKDGLVRYYKTEDNNKAKYSCNLGFKLLGSEYLLCDKGIWVGVEPKCEEIFCSHPGDLINGKIQLIGSGKYEYRSYVKKVRHNDQIEYSCDKDYKLIGTPGATCVNGSWSPAHLPRCERAEYPIFNHILRGKRQTAAKRGETGRDGKREGENVMTEYRPPWY